MHTDKQTHATIHMSWITCGELKIKTKISILYFAASTGAGCAPAPPPSPPRTWGGSAGGGSTATPTPPPTQRYTHHSSPSSSWWHHCFGIYYKYFYLTLHTLLSSRWTSTVPRPAQTTRTEASALTTDKLSVEGRMGFRRQKSESYKYIYFCVDKCIMILIIISSQQFSVFSHYLRRLGCIHHHWIRCWHLWSLCISSKPREHLSL